MKKIIFSLAMAFISVSAICQTTATEILERYNKVSGFDKVVMDKSSMLMEVDVNTPQGKMPMKLIKGSATQLRIEMTMVGQSVLVVMDGNKGWIKVPGQDVQPMPKEAMDQLASQGDVSNSLKVDDKLFNFTLIEDKNGVQVIQGTPKEPALKLGVKDATFSFDKNSGMMVGSTTKIEQKGKEIDVKVKMSGVKEFSGLKIPSKMSIKTTGIPEIEVMIRNMEVNYPVKAFMFAKPE